MDSNHLRLCGPALALGVLERFACITVPQSTVSIRVRSRRGFDDRVITV